MGFTWWFSSHGIEPVKKHQLNKQKFVNQVIQAVTIRDPTWSPELEVT